MDTDIYFTIAVKRVGAREITSVRPELVEGHGLTDVGAQGALCPVGVRLPRASRVITRSPFTQTAALLCTAISSCVVKGKVLRGGHRGGRREKTD